MAGCLVAGRGGRGSDARWGAGSSSAFTPADAEAASQPVGRFPMRVDGGKRFGKVDK